MNMLMTKLVSFSLIFWQLCNVRVGI